MDVLGISYSPDAAAAFVRDGEVLAAVTDERFTGKKHSRDFPTDSIRYCLQHAGTDLAALDAVAFFWNPGVHLESFDVRRSSGVRHHTEYLASVPNYLLSLYPRGWDELAVEHVEQRFHLKGAARPLRIVYVGHHQAHAASAFFPSPFEEAAVLTVDGYGERTSLLLGAGQGERLQVLRQTEFPDSLGAFYAAITQYLGFRANCDEGQVMGLAAHGEPRFYEAFRELVPLRPEGAFEVVLSHFAFHQQRPRRYSRRFVERFGGERRAGDPIDDRHRDIAASAQKLLEETLVHVARHLRRSTGLRRLCMAGGVALNCVANSRVIAEGGFDDAFLQPAAGDNGAALGAALYLQHQLEGRGPRRPMETDYLGPAFGDEQIERELREDLVPFVACPDIAAAAAELLAQGQVVGWFQGRMEFGPRALGNRSILADPRRAEVKQRLDGQIKRREAFRPYAPAVLAERHAEFVDGPGDSPFMLKSFSVRPEKRALVPAIVHVAGSARVQTVDSSRNPLLHRLISEFERRTGVPLLLNTSFNGRGETIVCTVKDALRCFFSTGLDALAIGHCLVRKPRA
jgi:carbamoyltransferase